MVQAPPWAEQPTGQQHPLHPSSSQKSSWGCILRLGPLWNHGASPLLSVRPLQRLPSWELTCLCVWGHWPCLKNICQLSCDDTPLSCPLPSLSYLMSPVPVSSCHCQQAQAMGQDSAWTGAKDGGNKGEGGKLRPWRNQTLMVIGG